MSANKIDQPLMGDPAAPAQGGMSHAGTDVRHEAQQTGEHLKQKTAETAEHLKQKGKESLDEIRHQAEEVASRQKDTLLEKLSHCSRASRRAADALREENDPTMAGYADALAGQIDRSADYVRSRDYRGMLHDTEGFARRHPEVFFGGMFVAGLALARFLKASSSERRLEDRHDFEHEAFESSAYPSGMGTQEGMGSLPVPASSPANPVNPPATTQPGSAFGTSGISGSQCCS